VGVYGGSLRPVPVEKFIANVIKALLQRSGLDGARLDDVIIAQSYVNGEAPCIGRYPLETMCVGSGQGVAAIFEHA
jgi:acetyl-CoA C-acetyltransferase